MLNQEGAGRFAEKPVLFIAAFLLPLAVQAAAAPSPAPSAKSAPASQSAPAPLAAPAAGTATAAAPAQATSGSAAAPPSGAPDLITAYQKALAQSPAFQEAQAEYRADIEARPQALAKILPQFGVQGSFLWSREHWSGQSFTPPTDLPPSIEQIADEVSQVDSRDTYTEPKYLFALHQALYTPQAFIGLDAADLEVAQAKVGLDSARAQLTLGVAQAYFGVLAARDKLRFALAKRDAFSQELEQATVRHESGLSAEANLDQIRAQYAASVAGVAQAQSDVEVALSALGVLTGEPYVNLRPLPDNVVLPPVEPDKIEPWVTQAVDQNFAVIADKLGTKIAKDDYDKARAQRLPTVNLVGNYSYERPTGGYPGEHLDIDRSIGVQVQQPIYSGGAIDSSIRAAKAGWDKALAIEDQARATATQATRTAFFNAIAGPPRLDALKQSVEAATQAQYQTRVGYEVGTKTTADVLLSINQRYEAETEYATARYQYLVYVLQLKLAAGILTATDLQTINKWLQ